MAAALADEGVWLTLSGSTEGAPRDAGPPGRSAPDLVHASEPSLEIVQLRAGEVDVCGERMNAWVCLSRKRAIPAQASSRTR